MSLRALITGIGKHFLKKKKPTTGKEQKLLTYDKTAPQKTGKELVKQDLKLPVAPLKKTRPLHMGSDKSPVFGSSTYDWVMRKGQGKFTADEWLDHLTTTRKINFKVFGKDATKTIREPKRFRYDSGPFRGKEVTISKEELFDTNLALFNEAGDLTGGLLYAAQKFGLKLDANTLGSMVKLNPLNRLQAIEFGLPKGAGQALEVGGKRISSELSKLKGKYANKFAIADELEGAIYEAGSLSPTAGQNTIRRSSESIIKKLNAIKKSENIEAADKLIINRLIGEVDDVARPFKKKGLATQYGDESTYTLQGGKDYRETIWKLNEDIPGNSAARKSMSHFGDAGDNMVYHVRFDTRLTPDGKKVFMINEIQSDANQGVAKALTKFQQLAGERRVNPFQADIEMKLLTQNRTKLLEQMDEAIKAGNYNQSGRIGRELKNINEKLKKTYTKVDDYTEKKFDYFPMVEADAYGDHALKYLINKASKEGVDYVAVAPFNKLSFRQGYKAGNERFYGYSSGKGINKKGSAVMPDLMKKVARFYDSKAGPVKISLSDPAKPYKKIATDKFTYPAEHSEKGKKILSKYHKDARVDNMDGYTLMEPNDPNLYFDAFAIKVTPFMKQTLKTYRAMGGLVVDIFKTIRYNAPWQ